MVSTRITALVRIESVVEPFLAFKADKRSSSGEQEEQNILSLEYISIIEVIFTISHIVFILMFIYCMQQYIPRDKEV
jgi:hypothetical protein